MKRFALLITLILLISSPVMVVASDITNAGYLTKISYDNAGTALNDTVGTFTLDTQQMINGGYASNAYDFSMKTGAGGTDIAFMPSVNATYPWCSWIPSIGASGSINQYLYSKDVSGGKIRWFPGEAGGSVSDHATLEPSDNFTITQSGYINTDNGSAKYLVEKSEAFRTWVSDNESGAINSGIYGNHLADSFADHSTSWTDDALSSDGNIGTVAIDTIDATQWTGWLQLSYDYYILSPSIRFHAGIVNHTGGDLIDVDAYYNGAWQDVYQGTFTDDTWTTKTYTDGLIHSCNGTRVRIYNGATNGETARVGELEINGYYPQVSATGISSGERTVAVTSGNFTTLGTGDALHFDGTANSYVDLGNIYDAQPTLVNSLWFKLDANYSAGAPVHARIWDKRTGGADYALLFIDKSTGKLTWRMTTGGVQRFYIQSAQSSWAADTWYHVLFATNSVYLIVNNGVPVTDANTSYMVNGGNIIVGQQSGDNQGLVGHIANYTIFTDNLTAGEKAGLYNGILPGDEVEQYYIDESYGTNIISYGTGGNDGTAQASTSWDETTRPGDYTIWVDGTPYGTANLKGASVPDNANDWVFCTNSTMPYVEYIEVEVDGVQVGAWDYEYAETFTDDSGNGNTLTPTFPTASYDADVTSEILSLDSLAEPDVPPVEGGTGWTMITSTPDEPSELFTEGEDTWGIGDFNFGELITDAADEAGQDSTTWLIWFAHILAGIAGVGAFGAANRRMGNNPSFLLAAWISVGVLALFMVLGVIPGVEVIILGLLLVGLTVLKLSRSLVD